MNAPLKNFLTFIAAIVLGVLLIWANASLFSFLVSPITAGAAAFGGGICLFLFGRPHENPRQGQIVWGLLGLASGLIAPYALIYAMYAG